MDPRNRLTTAQAAANVGDYETALSEHIWFHHHALEYQPSLYGVRLSFALSYWKKLGDVYPPAMVALRKIRDDKTASLLRGEADREIFHDVASINKYLEEDASTYDLFRTLHENAPAFAQQCSTLAIDAIVAAKDFLLAARYSPDPESAVLAFSDDLNKDVARHRAGPPVKAPRLDAYIHIYCGRVRNTLRILTGLARPLDAELAREWAVALVEDRRVRDRVRTALYSNDDT
jgi:hypothetical protein